MQNTIKNLEKKPFSGETIMKLIEGKANLMSYPELATYNNIDDVLGKYRAVVILYETKQDFGHWVCLFEREKNKLEFFDSYGLMPDDQLKFIPDHFRKVSNQKFSHLTWLLYNSGYKIEYNHYHFQKYLNNVSTCGRWVSMRLIFRNTSLQGFIRLFRNTKYIDGDTLVTLLTSMIVK